MTISDIEQTEKQIRKVEKRQAKIDSMRALLDFLETHPIVPMPYFTTVNAFPKHGSDISKIARAMKPVDKSQLGTLFILSRRFGNVTLEVNFGRDEVCERVVVGTEDIPEKIIPATTREIVEWVCPDSVLAHG